MKKFILSAVITLMVAGSVEAQERKSKQKQHWKQNKSWSASQPTKLKGQLYNQLNLSSNQRVQADRLNQNLASRLQSMNSNSRLPQQQKRMAVLNLVQQHQNGFHALLSPQQSQQYNSLLGSGALSQGLAGNSALASLLGDYGWVVNLLGSNLNLGSLLGGNLDIASLLGLFTR
ncbi:hypothetical protein [Aridibaculum aurantiacum]|uniref:hypothetical protein n=1 Tax=Aridibaculum aurantiacum TaxID=2810307 RepID=UPI001A95EC41|nr:hypothetical protein [Aridibaculum aurantiacum]